ncbi:MAG: matrixin family metalloprotease [Candidatus Obscuribacterales bacterium]|nr:matrixin family metalloprotease [Candidatus Obscuribacterales bacterium]
MIEVPAIIPKPKSKKAAPGLALAFFLALGAPPSGQADDAFSGLLSDLSELERKVQAPADPAAPMVQRLSNLELRLFGSPRSGSMIERLDSLKSAARELPTALPQNRQASANVLNAMQPAPATPLSSMDTHIPPGAFIRRNFSEDALPLLNAFPPQFQRIEPDSTALEARPDYYNDVLKASKGKTIRFKSMPVPVYIQPYPDKAFVNCVLRAFESWEFQTDGLLKFSQIDNPNQARIQVVWKHLGADKDRSGCLLGAHTILKYTNHGSGSLSLMSVGAVPVPIYIPRMGPKYTVPPQVMEVNLDLILSKEQSVRYPCLQNIVTHELGHALGLLGHSPNQADIMYPVTDEYSRLSQRDLNTLIKLYKQKCDVPL